MTDEQLAELKAAWPGEWRDDGWGDVYTREEHGLEIEACWEGLSDGPVVSAGPARSARNCKTFTEAVASFRADAEKVAKVYAALAGKTLV